MGQKTLAKEQTAYLVFLINGTLLLRATIEGYWNRLHTSVYRIIEIIKNKLKHAQRAHYTHTHKVIHERSKDNLMEEASLL